MNQLGKLTLLFLFINLSTKFDVVYGAVGGPAGQAELQITGEVVINTKLGQLRGNTVTVTPLYTHSVLMDNQAPPKEAYSFQGVRYSEPVNRFDKPTPKKPWTGIVNATQMAPAPIPYIDSARYQKIEYAEDVLYVDIYTPADATNTSKLPVLFYVHGGGFEIGAAQFYPKQPFVNLIVSHRVIFVMCEYRLGLYGFGTNGQPDFAGNLGLWDQAAGLKWVSENIESFGGDPKRITIAGNSAGGASSSALSLSTHTRDLFNQSILISGSMYNGWARQRSWVVEQTKIIADSVGCGSVFSDSPKLKSCLSNVSVSDLSWAMYYSGYAHHDMYALRFTAHPDGDFFTDELDALIASGPKKPTLTGIAELEMMMYVQTDFEFILGQNIPQSQWHDFDKTDLSDWVREQLAHPAFYGSNATALKIQNEIVEYFMNNPRKVYKAECTNGYVKHAVDIASAISFNYNSFYEARKKSEAGWPVYFYLNTFWDKQNTYSQIPYRGHHHALDQAYWLGWWLYPVINPFPPKQLSASENQFAEYLLNSFIQFIKTGDPSLPANAVGSNSTGIKWPRVGSFDKPLSFVALDTQPTVYTDGLWEGVTNFIDCLRCNYPEFDIAWANGALATKTGNADACKRCTASGAGKKKKRSSKHHHDETNKHQHNHHKD